MPEAVRAAVVEVCVAHGAMQEAEAQTYVEQMEAQERWQEECWS
jgi:sulfite reductase alpha subunit-like flavoprotein